MRVQKDGRNNLSEVLQMPEMQNYLLLGSVAYEIMTEYQSVIEQSLQISNIINTQYN